MLWCGCFIPRLPCEALPQAAPPYLVSQVLSSSSEDFGAIGQMHQPRGNLPVGSCALLTGHAFCALSGTIIRLVWFPEPVVRLFATVTLPFFHDENQCMHSSVLKKNGCFKYLFGLKNCTHESVEDTFMVGCLTCMSTRCNSKLQQTEISLPSHEKLKETGNYDPWVFASGCQVTALHLKSIQQN